MSWSSTGNKETDTERSRNKDRLKAWWLILRRSMCWHYKWYMPYIYSTFLAIAKPMQHVNKYAEKYLLSWLCCLSGQNKHHHDQQTENDPEETLSECETEPCRQLVPPSSSPEALKHWLYNDPVLPLVSVQASRSVVICTLWLLSSHCWANDKALKGRYCFVA